MKRFFKNINPAILIMIFLLLGNKMLTSGQSLGDWLYMQLLMLPGIVIGLTFHEAAHGYMSAWLGDPTPRLQGRLSLNPLKHIDPIGFLCLFFAGFGWGRPVEINPMYYKHKRRDELLVSLAGVATNFLIAVIAALIFKNMPVLYIFSRFAGLWNAAVYVMYYMISINIVLMIFNLIPVPPLDGFGVVTQLFNLSKYSWYYKLYDNGMLILMILIVLNITDKIINPLYGMFMGMLIG